MQAARLLEKGYSQFEVARQVGAHRQSVSQWAAELREKGRAGLKEGGPCRTQAAAERGGPPPDRAGTETRPGSSGL